MTISNESESLKFRPNRTFICSVVFLDIVEYSKKTVEEQIILKRRFNTIIAEIMKDIPENDRIILDTGDGAAIGFLGDPEDALIVAMSIRGALNNEPKTNMPVLLVRIGINLGPVKLIKDINNQINLIGDGINIAQRVMAFAEPGQLLASRSYYDVVSRLSQEYLKLFQYIGARSDKHVREHYVYAVGDTESQTKLATHEPEKTSSPAIVENEIHDQEETPSKNISDTNKPVIKVLEPARNNKKVIMVTAVIAVIIVAVFFFMPKGKNKSSSVKTSDTASNTLSVQTADTASNASPEKTSNIASNTDKESEQAEIVPDVRSLVSDEISFIYNDIKSTGGKVILLIHIRNNSKAEKSVALYDSNFKWPKSKLIDQTGKEYEVTKVNFNKSSKNITSQSAETKGINIKPHETVRATLVFNKIGKSIKLIHIHPFIYKSRWSWEERDLIMKFSVH